MTDEINKPNNDNNKTDTGSTFGSFSKEKINTQQSQNPLANNSDSINFKQIEEMQNAIEKMKNDIEKMKNSIEQKNKEWIDFSRDFAKTKSFQEKALKEQETKIKEQEAKFNEQETKIKEQEAKFNEQETKIKEQEAKFNEQETKIKEQEAKFNEQETKIKEQEAKFNEQETKIKEQEAKFNKQETKIKEQEAKFYEQEKKIDDNKTKIIETMGVFVALFTFISVSTNILLKFQNIYNAMFFLSTFALILISFLIFFHCILNNKMKKLWMVISIPAIASLGFGYMAYKNNVTDEITKIENENQNQMCQTTDVNIGMDTTISTNTITISTNVYTKKIK